MVLDKKGILAEVKGQSEEVAFGKGKILVSELSFNEVNAVRESPLIKGTDGEVDGFRFVGLLVCSCIRDAKGNRVFDDNDIDTVMGLPRSQYVKIAEVAKRLNGMEDDAVKNSEADQIGS